jgi:preprotein translocase subunit SecE
VLTVDRIKMVLAVLVLAAGIVGYYYLGDKALVVRVLAFLGALVVAAVIAFTSAPGRAAWAFGREALVELRKVVWPTRKETGQVTLVVVAMVIFVSLFLWFVDWVLTYGVKALTGQGS